jgi:cathepsin B
MFKASLFASTLSIALSAQILPGDETIAAIRTEIVDAVNNAKTTWKAAIPSKFQNATIADVKRTLGTILPGEKEYIAPDLEKVYFTIPDSAIPESFDVRTAWPECSSVTGRVRDQSSCG